MGEPEAAVSNAHDRRRTFPPTGMPQFILGNALDDPVVCAAEVHVAPVRKGVFSHRFHRRVCSCGSAAAGNRGNTPL